jgi:hypothetical protein
VIADPPSEDGAVQVTVAEALPGVTVRMVGGSGTVAGVTVFEGLEAAPTPTTLAALTLKE